MELAELPMNLWAYIDEGTGMVDAVFRETYALTGPDDEKQSTKVARETPSASGRILRRSRRNWGANGLPLIWGSSV
jgi:hypothetical protein